MVSCQCDMSLNVSAILQNLSERKTGCLHASKQFLVEFVVAISIWFEIDGDMCVCGLPTIYPSLTYLMRVYFQ